MSEDLKPNMGAEVSPSKTRRWPRVLLVISLTLNLLILGLIAGAWYGNHRTGAVELSRGERDLSREERGAMRDLGFGPIAGALDRRDKRAIGRAFRARTGSLSENRKTLAKEFQAMLAALRAEPFDPELLKDQLGTKFARQQERSEVLRGLLLERISQMSAEERRVFADRIERSVRRHKR